jgi:hypothetical protein
MTVTQLHTPGRIRRFARLGPAAQAQFALSWLLLGLTRAAIALLPFAHVRRLLGEGRTDPPDLPPASARDARRSRRIERAARYTPWRSDCYPQALTAHLQLRLARVPHTVTFGLRRAEHGLTAHAWVRSADRIVTGGDPRAYMTVGSFTWLPRPERRT